MNDIMMASFLPVLLVFCLINVGSGQEAPYRIHTLFSVECQNYFDWQTVGLVHSFRKARQPGPITRLLSCTDEEKKKYKGMNLAPTFEVPSMSRHPRTGDWYPAINKPAGVVHWLKHSKDAQNVDWVVILDADMIIRGPILPWEIGAEKGRPVAAYYGYLVGCDNILAKLHTKNPELCDKVGGLLAMHIDDLRALAPMWLSKTEEVREDKAHWATNITGDIYGKGWISEMYGYSFGAAEDGVWDTIKWSLTFVRDLMDVCLYSYFSMTDDLRKQDPPGGRIEIRVVCVPIALVVGLLGFAVDFPVITVIAVLKGPYMLLKGWHRLFHDCIGREGPFLESICVPFAGLAILLWPFAVAGAVLASMLAGIFLGFYAAVVAYQESSFYLGICYIVATLSIYDEYSNDILDMPEGSCFPRPRYRKNAGLQSGSTTPSVSRPVSFKNPPSRSSSFTNPMIELKPLVLLDSLFQECRRQGEFMVLDGVITVKEIDDAKSGKASGRVISIGLPAYCLFQTLLRSAKANSTGILLEDNVTEINTANRPKDGFYDWFLNPLLVMKDQIKAQNLTDSEAEYLGKLVMLSGDAEKLKNSNIGPPPESELRRAELDALARRLQGITKSISRYPTYRRRFENSIKAISEELDRRDTNRRGSVSGSGSESTFGRRFSNQRSFKTKTSNQEDDQEVERDIDVV
ncbi:putative uncharacterized membrane protein [Helianthus annuus]|nr:putative uncharacterized membrane protein [Helianthus annuus]